MDTVFEPLARWLHFWLPQLPWQVAHDFKPSVWEVRPLQCTQTCKLSCTPWMVIASPHSVQKHGKPSVVSGVCGAVRACCAKFLDHVLSVLEKSIRKKWPPPTPRSTHCQTRGKLGSVRRLRRRIYLLVSRRSSKPASKDAYFTSEKKRHWARHKYFTKQRRAGTIFSRKSDTRNLSSRCFGNSKKGDTNGRPVLQENLKATLPWFGADPGPS